jgi:anti-sigma factor RsiW
MTTNVLPFDPGVHKVVDALLPWYVNGKLEAAEVELVEQHVEHCSRCRGEIEWLRNLHAACVSGAREKGSAAPFSKLRGYLEQRQPGHARTPSSTATGWMRWALAGQFAAMLGLATIAWTTWTAHEPQVVYRTLAAPQSTARTGALVVVFDPATTEPELRRVLRSVGANIVSGPTPQGAYVIDVPDDRVSGAREALRAERSVVLAEPLQQPAR